MWQAGMGLLKVGGSCMVERVPVGVWVKDVCVMLGLARVIVPITETRDACQERNARPASTGKAP